MSEKINEKLLDLEELRDAIKDEYKEVAINPEKGFHFHTGRKLTALLGYKEQWLENVPDEAINSAAGTGNPFTLGDLKPGERVVDVGCGAGMDSFIAAQMVGPSGRVIAVDMTEEMLEKARASAQEAGVENIEFKQGYGEELPVEDGWADVIISNGVLNLMPDKIKGLNEMARVLKPTGRLQISDIVVQKTVPDSGKQQIDLWTG